MISNLNQTQCFIITSKTVYKKVLIIFFNVIKELRSTISTAKTEVHSWKTACQEEAENLGTTNIIFIILYKLNKFYEES